MLDLISMGEAMVQFNATSVGPLRTVNCFEKHSAGAESNVVVVASRMGLKSGFITKLGTDEFGRYLFNTIRGEGVDVSRVKWDNKAPTGIYFIQRGYPIPGQSILTYYRKGSAASRLGKSDLDFNYIRGCKTFHITGITPALSETCRVASKEAVSLAKKGGAKVSLDTNIRPQLWDREEAKKTILEILNNVDILLIDPTDSGILVGEINPHRAIPKLHKVGPEIVIVKMGVDGIIASEGKKIVRKPSIQVPVTDPIGAGDAFAGGFLSSLISGLDFEEALDIGIAAGTLVVTTMGDQESIPSIEDARKLLKYFKGR